MLDDTARLAREVDVVLDRVAGRPAAALVVLSALAEGADRLVARRALARPGAVLEVVLPLPAADYLADFASEESRAEFRNLLAAAASVEVAPPAATRDEAYEAAGFMVADRCDVLLALWDGAAARGRGGTADVVARARARGVPVEWVRVAR